MDILNFLFPKECILCSRIGNDICDSCIKKFSHTLPSCPICNKVNMGYESHNECFDIKIHFFTGWYLSKDIEYKLLQKSISSIYSPYTYLLDKLIDYLNIKDVIHNSTLLPLFVDDRNEYLINKRLVNHIKQKNPLNKNILFVGYLLNSDKIVRDNLKRLPLWESFNISFLTLFKSIQMQE